MTWKWIVLAGAAIFFLAAVVVAASQDGRVLLPVIGVVGVGAAWKMFPPRR